MLVVCFWGKKQIYFTLRFTGRKIILNSDNEDKKYKLKNKEMVDKQ